jgi:hypothetical protein
MDNINLNKCKICGKEVAHDSHFYKTHKISAANYYQSNWPRYDIYDNSLINFKNRDQYFNTDFNSKTNLKIWLKKVPKEESQRYLKNYLLNRKKKKGLIFSPCQIELRSLPIPGIKYFNESFGDYYKLCEELGFINKFTQTKFKLKPKDLSRKHIIIDSREQKSLDFKLRSRVEALKFGDYKLVDDEFACDCFIERKSLSDFYGTLTGGYERFRRELERAKEAEAYLIVLVESSFESVASFIYQPQVRGKIKIAPEFVYHNMRELIKDFPNVQFLFVDGRKEAVRVIEKIFASNCEYKECDLQLMFDIGEL